MSNTRFLSISLLKMTKLLNILYSHQNFKIKNSFQLVQGYGLWYKPIPCTLGLTVTSCGSSAYAVEFK